MSLVRKEGNTYIFSDDIMPDQNQLLQLIGYNARKSESKKDSNPPLQEKPTQRWDLLEQFFNATLTDESSNKSRFRATWGEKSSTKRKEKILNLLWSFIKRGKGTDRGNALVCWKADMAWVERYCNPKPKLSKNKRNLKQPQIPKSRGLLSSPLETPSGIDFDKEQLIRENAVLKKENASLRDRIQEEKDLKVLKDRCNQLQSTKSPSWWSSLFK